MRNFFRMIGWCGWAMCGSVSGTESTIHLREPPLSGVVTDAGISSPVLLIIPGSGPTDHDGNSPLGVKAQPYRLLANELLSRDISVVRVDKRGMFLSRSAIENPNDVTLETYARDALTWAAYLSDARHVSCVWVLGHSEGSQVAALAAHIDARHICGLILASAPGRPGWAVLSGQLHARLLVTGHSHDMQAVDGAIDALRHGHRVQAANLPPMVQGLFRDNVQAYLMDWFRHDPVSDLAGSQVPTLVIEGTADQQVSVADGALLRQARPDVQLVIVNGMNHVWKASTSDSNADLATYAREDLPVMQALPEAIAQFMKKHPKGIGIDRR